MNQIKNTLIAIALFVSLSSAAAWAEEFVVTEPSGEAYQYVSVYRIEIDAPKEVVWPHLIKLGSWMYDFELSHHAGSAGEVGEVLRLYPNQEFFVQITSIVKDQTLAITNLPSTFGGEYSTGVGVINLAGDSEKATVFLTMSRRYSGGSGEENPMKQQRSSTEFQEGTSAAWNRFLGKLKELAEASHQNR